jgi:F-type H+-transporting ATPase subunit a
MDVFNLIDKSLLVSGGVEVGVHYYWDIGGISLHGQVFLIIWFVCILQKFCLVASFEIEQAPCMIGK